MLPCLVHTSYTSVGTCQPVRERYGPDKATVGRVRDWRGGGQTWKACEVGSLQIGSGGWQRWVVVLRNHLLPPYVPHSGRGWVRGRYIYVRRLLAIDRHIYLPASYDPYLHTYHPRQILSTGTDSARGLSGPFRPKRPGDEDGQRR